MHDRRFLRLITLVFTLGIKRHQKSFSIFFTLSRRLNRILSPSFLRSDNAQRFSHGFFFINQGAHFVSGGTNRFMCAGNNYLRRINRTAAANIFVVVALA